MPNFRRINIPGGCYFFTVITAGRQPILIENIDPLRAAFRYVKKRHPFNLDAIVILPDHLHCIWTLPSNDGNNSTRWRLLKSYFSRQIPCPYGKPGSGERGIWQRRYWEHLIVDEYDYRTHMDYIHYNPVKHGYAGTPVEWPYTTFHQLVDKGMYDKDWGGNSLIDKMEFE